MKKTLAELKALWVTGYTPTEADFADLFDSYPNFLSNILATPDGRVYFCNQNIYTEIDAANSHISIVPDLSALTSLSVLNLGDNQITSFAIPSSVNQLIRIELVNNQVDQSSVDGILSWLNSCGLSGGTVILNLGTNAIPTDGDANADVVALRSRGWAVFINT